MKLIIIHQNIESEILLINSFNSECIICKMSDYIFLEESLNNNIDYKDIIQQLLNGIDDLSCLTHLTFVYKFYGDYNIPFFITSNNTEYHFFNENIINLINLLKIQNKNIIVDILTCNLKSNNFIESVNKLKLDLNLNIRYSIDQNNKWILESDNYDIKNEYFTDSILDWSGQFDINYSNSIEPCSEFNKSTYSPIPLPPTDICVNNGILSWTSPNNLDNVNLSGYKIYLLDNDFNKFISTTDSTFLNLESLELPLGDNIINITSYNMFGESYDISGEIKFSYNIPSIVQNLTSYIISPNQINLNWHPPLNSGGFDISGYIISYYDILSPSIVTNILNILTTSIHITTLSKDSTYKFIIKAFNKLGTGDLTSISATTLQYNINTEIINTEIINTDNLIISRNGLINMTTITGLTNGTSYTFTVVATNIKGSSEPSIASVPITPLTVPNEPTNISGIFGNTQVTLSWTTPTDDGGANIISYNIYKSIDGITYSLDYSSNTTTKLITNLLSNTIYYFKISAINKGEGDLSNVFTEATLPGRVKTLVAVQGYKSVYLYWNRAIGNALIIGYLVEKSIDNISWTTDIFLNNTTFYNSINLTNDTLYYYRVSAINTSGIGTVSKSVSATPTGSRIISTIPSNPNKPMASSITPTSMTLSWTTPNANGPHITHYNIYRSTDSSGFIFDSSSNTITKNIINLFANTTYYLRITAVNSNGESLQSDSLKQATTGTGTTTGDPIITTIYGETYLLPNVNARFILFNNRKIDYPLYITADCFFLTPKELMNSVFISKWATDYTFMKTLAVKFKNYEINIDMNTLNITPKNIDNNQIIINNIYEDKMILSRHYSANRKRELENNLKFNGKSRKIDLIHEDKIYTLRVSVDLGCADHRNEFVLEGSDMKSGYGAIISKNHNSKLMNL